MESEEKEIINYTIDLESGTSEIVNYFMDLHCLDKANLEKNETEMNNFQLLTLAIELQKNRIEIEKFNLTLNGIK